MVADNLSLVDKVENLFDCVLADSALGRASRRPTCRIDLLGNTCSMCLCGDGLPVVFTVESRIKEPAFIRTPK